MALGFIGFVLIADGLRLPWRALVVSARCWTSRSRKVAVGWRSRRWSRRPVNRPSRTTLCGRERVPRHRAASAPCPPSRQWPPP